MCYLNSPRLIFTGDFKSDVSTVNNDPAHYNNQTFIESFQQFGQNTDNGWWNPEGGASFSFQNCRVRQASMPDGRVMSAAADDIVIGMTVGDAGNRATGKMVDLDPQEQGSSELWAVKLRISTAENELLLQGDIKPTGFRDLQMRQTDGGAANGQPLGGTWTSVLENIEWGARADASDFLKKLRETSDGGKLSVNMHAFGYYYSHAPDGRFSMGRILGSIGPWFDGEPQLFAPARRLYGILAQGQSVFFGASNFLFEKEKGRLTLDLGGSFPVADSIGTIGITRTFILGVSKSAIKNGAATAPLVIKTADFTEIGPLNYSKGDWLDKTGGIVVFDGLSEDAATALEDNQLVLLAPSSTTPGSFTVVAREAIDGRCVKADEFVQRLDTAETHEIGIYSYRYGKPVEGDEIAVTLEAPTPVTPLGPGNPISEIPGNNYPAEGLTFLSPVKTGPDGKAVLSLTGNAIESPRGYIDGQIYTLDYQVQGIDNDAGEASIMPQENIFIHLRDHFEVPASPVWGDISETMTQFGNLYPIMSKYLVDLSSPVAVKAKKDILTFAFTRPIEDTLHMPVTRDLSEAKRQTILKWLAAPAVENEGLEEDKIAPAEAKVPESPAAPGTELTDKQAQLKNAVRAKSGAMMAGFKKVEDLFENI